MERCASYAEGIVDDAPPELTLAWRAQRWGTPPWPGGVETWPLAGVTNLEAALNTYNAFKARAGFEDAYEFSKKFPELTQFCATVDRLRGLLSGKE